ncbi:MAG: hypothetical protein M1357_00765 [Candidatus Marsarchaeota archaeon]|nr:hypothetical protein [Candidatus Marsarchaeota archaeon]
MEEIHVQEINQSVRRDTLGRIGSFAVGTSMITASYYSWLASGYLNLFYIVLSWVMLLGGIYVIIRSLVCEPVTVNRLFEGRTGLILSAAASSVAAYAYLTYGFVRAGGQAVIIYLVAFSILVALNSSGSTPRFMNLTKIKLYSRTGSIAAILGLLLMAFLLTEPVLALAVIGASLALCLLIPNREKTNIWITLSLFASLSAFSVGALANLPRYGTDELAIEMYAAKLVLAGRNPYSFAYFTGVFHVFPVPLSSLTPVVGGGFVSSLMYPALSFEVFLPSLLLHVDPRLTIVAFSSAVMLILVYHYHRNSFDEFAPIALIVVTLDSLILEFPAASVTDSIWVALLAASYVLKTRKTVSAVLFGLSLSFKQLAFTAAPFYVYYIYKERGILGAAGFTLISAITFLAVNLPYIVLSPTQWLSSLTGPVTSRLVGIGQGASMISFTGLYTLPRIYFAGAAAAVSALLIATYVFKHSNLRYSLFILPLLALFFNYRFLFNYAAYWPILSLLTLPEVSRYVGSHPTTSSPGSSRLFPETPASGSKPSHHMAQPSKHSLTWIVVCLVIIGLVGAAPAVHASTNPVYVDGVTSLTKVVGGPDIITTIVVNISHGVDQTSRPEVRIFDGQNIFYANGLLWNASVLRTANNWSLYRLVPMAPNQSLPANTSFVVEFYLSGYKAYFFYDGSARIYDQPFFQVGLHIEAASQRSYVSSCYQGVQSSYVKVAPLNFIVRYYYQQLGVC